MKEREAKIIQKVIVNVGDSGKRKKRKVKRVKKSTFKTKEDIEYYKGLSPAFGGYVVSLAQEPRTQNFEMDKIFKPLIEGLPKIASAIMGSNALGQAFNFNSNQEIKKSLGGPVIEEITQEEYENIGVPKKINEYLENIKKEDELREENINNEIGAIDIFENLEDIPAAAVQEEIKPKKKVIIKKKKQFEPFSRPIIKDELEKLRGSDEIKLVWNAAGGGVKSTIIKVEDYEDFRNTKLKTPIAKGGLGKVSNKNLKILY